MQMNLFEITFYGMYQLFFRILHALINSNSQHLKVQISSVSQLGVKRLKIQNMASEFIMQIDICTPITSTTTQFRRHRIATHL